MACAVRVSDKHFNGFYTRAETCKEYNIQPKPNPKKFLIPETRLEPKKNFFKPKPDPNPNKNFFQTQTRPEPEKKFFFNPKFKEFLLYNFSA